MGLFHADTTVGGDGSDYTDDDNITTGLFNGGHIIRIVPMFQQVVNIALWVKNKALDVFAYNLDASASADSALNSATVASNKYIQFDNRYLGVKSSSPTTDNYGGALVIGALYFDSVGNVMKTWNGSSWIVAYVPTSGFMIGANNLSDLTDTVAAIDNLGCLKKALFFAAN
jgi:hypothetical protein